MAGTKKDHGRAIVETTRSTDSALRARVDCQPNARSEVATRRSVAARMPMLNAHPKNCARIKRGQGKRDAKAVLFPLITPIAASMQSLLFAVRLAMALFRAVRAALATRDPVQEVRGEKLLKGSALRAIRKKSVAPIKKICRNTKSQR